MGYRGAPLGVKDYIRHMDEQLRDLRANAGTTRIPSQRIGGYIVEIDDSSGSPLIKLTEVATGIVTYCCQVETDEEACFEVPFSWYGIVDAPDAFPAYLAGRQFTIREIAVLQYVTSDDLHLELVHNNTAIASFTTINQEITTFNLDPGITIFPNDKVTINLADVGGGLAEDVTIILRSCRNPFQISGG